MLTLTNRIDMRPGAVPLVIHLGQYDSDFSLVFELYSSAGNFTVESGTTAMIRGTKTDGNAYDADATIDVSAKTVTVAGSEQMTAAKGRNVYELVLTKSGKVLSTANFILDVERAAMDADTIASESVLKELNAIIAGAATATEAAADAATAADRAEDAAESVSSASTQIATNTADIADLKEDLSDIIDGTGTPDYLYTFENFKTDVPTWNSYNADDFTITNSSVTIGDAAQHFIYKRNFFQYADNSNITVKLKIKIDYYAGGTVTQQLRITASGYSESNVIKDIIANKSGTVVTYNNVNYNIGDEIEVVFTFEHVAINALAYIGLNNKNNPNAPALEVSITDFEVFYTAESNVTKVKYAEQSDYAKSLVKRYEGKTWCAVGDSLTAPYYDVYVSYVADATGLVATNYGRGGTTVAHVDGDNTSMVDRVCGLNGNTGYNDSVDLWTLFGGINDAYGSVPIGTISDTIETTFYGALNLICEHLLSLENHPTIALIAPYDAKSVTEQPYVDAIVAIGLKYSLPVLNLKSISGINSYNWTYYLRDAVHPNQNGADKLRPIILQWFEQLRLPEVTPSMPH